jgi:hypothetical protein
MRKTLHPLRTFLLGVLAIAVTGSCFGQSHDTVPAREQPLVTTLHQISGLQVHAPTDRVELFNGKNLEGWTFHFRTNTAPSATFGVTNGILHCNGQPAGYMRTEKNYRDYKLTVEWRFVKVAPKADNTGILLHLQMPDKIWPKSIECQGQYQNQGDLFLIGGTSCKVGGEVKNNRAPKRGESAEKPAGEWNTYEIVCAGNTMKVWVNGTLLNQATECSVSEGPIGVQSEGSEWELRKMFLEPVKME